MNNDELEEAAWRKWWEDEGRLLDPDPGEADWFKKRDVLTAYAFAAGAAFERGEP